MRPCVEGEQRVQYMAQNRTSAVHLLEAEVKRRLQLLPQAPQQAGEGEGSQHTPHLIQKRTQSTYLSSPLSSALVPGERGKRGSKGKRGRGVKCARAHLLERSPAPSYHTPHSCVQQRLRSPTEMGEGVAYRLYQWSSKPLSWQSTRAAFFSGELFPHSAHSEQAGGREREPPADNQSK